MTIKDIDIFEKELEDRTKLCCALADKDAEIERLTDENAALRSRLDEAEAHIESLCRLVEWWEPKDGTPRTTEARAFLARKE